MRLEKLPIEILVSILKQLDVKSLTRCRQVCHLFRKVIDSTTAIQYSLELDASSALDGYPGSLSKSDRLQRLRGLNRAWKHLSWSARLPKIPIQNYASVYELSDGLFVQDINDTFQLGNLIPPSSTISWMKLPSNGESRMHPWMKRTFDFRVADLCLDVDRDLLVLVERIHHSHIHLGGENAITVTCKLHLLRLSTNEPHPAAENHIINHSFIAESVDYAMIVQLSGDHIGLLLSTRHDHHARNDRFFIWEWTTGSCKGDESPKEGQWDTFCFLSHDTVLIPDTAAGRLNVFVFSGAALSLQLAASMGLPPIVSECRLHQITARSEPPPRNPSAPPPSPRTGMTFITDPTAAIVVLTLDYLQAPLPGENFFDGLQFNLAQPQLVVTHRETLLKRARDGVKYQLAFGFPAPFHEWDTWGKLGTRWGLGPVPPRWVCYVHGQRYVSMAARPFEAHHPMSLQLYDFNIKNATRSIPAPKASTNARTVPSAYPENPAAPRAEDDVSGEDEERLSKHVRRAFNVCDETTTKAQNIFQKDFVTSLPYRCVQTEAVFNWDSVMIDGERVIGLKEELDGLALESLDVLVL